MRTSLAPLLLVPVLSGCVTRPIDPGATDTATSSSTGGTTSASTSPSPTTSTSTSAAPSTGAPPDSTGAAASSGNVFVEEFDQLRSDCDVWAEDCPEGQKCMPVSLDGGGAWESLRCVPIAPNPGQIGEPCMNLGTGLDGLDTCGLHMMCWDVDPDTNTGACLGMCTGSPESPGCADPNASCVIAGDGVLTLCIPRCDPLAQDCPAEDGCLPSPTGDEFFCVLDLSGDEGQVFDPCEYINVCDPGLVCLDAKYAAECDPMALGCCLPFCDVTEPNTCAGQGQQCLPWFQDAPPPPQYANVGVCAIPMP